MHVPRQHTEAVHSRPEMKALMSIPMARLARKTVALQQRTHFLLTRSNHTLYQFSDGFPESLQHKFTSSFLIHQDFITPSEEEALVKEVDPHLQRQVYEQDHWDEAIVGFRETERKHWNSANKVVISRLQETAFDLKKHKLLPYVHVLDLSAEGHIKPHVDSVRFCGDVVAVLSLLSPAVAKFAHTEEKNHVVQCLVPQRSLYIMAGTSRHNFTHEILPKDLADSSCDWAVDYPRSRRISIVCRCHPEEDDD